VQGEDFRAKAAGKPQLGAIDGAGIVDLWWSAPSAWVDHTYPWLRRDRARPSAPARRRRHEPSRQPESRRLD